MLKLSLICILFFVSGCLGFLTSLYVHSHSENKTTILKKDPVVSNKNSVRTFHYPSTFVNDLANDPGAGRKIFKEFCAVCHSNKPNIDVKAPLIGNKKVWQLKQNKGKEKLLQNTISGMGAMPARGGCFECSDQQLQQAIQYILDYPKLSSP